MSSDERKLKILPRISAGSDVKDSSSFIFLAEITDTEDKNKRRRRTTV